MHDGPECDASSLMSRVTGVSLHKHAAAILLQDVESRSSTSLRFPDLNSWSLFVRESFPFDQQFNILMRFIVDQTQTPNLKVK